MGKVKKRDLIKIRIEQAKVYYKEGYTVAEISPLVHLTEDHIRSILKKEGLWKAKKKIYFPPREDVIIAEYKKGKGINEIASEHLMSNYDVSNVLKKNKLIEKRYSYGDKTFYSVQEMNLYRRDVIRQIILLYNEGKSLEQIAGIFKLSVPKVRYNLSRSQVIPPLRIRNRKD